MLFPELNEITPLRKKLEYTNGDINTVTNKEVNVNDWSGQNVYFAMVCLINNYIYKGK